MSKTSKSRTEGISGNDNVAMADGGLLPIAVWSTLGLAKARKPCNLEGACDATLALLHVSSPTNPNVAMISIPYENAIF